MNKRVIIYIHTHIHIYIYTHTHIYDRELIWLTEPKIFTVWPFMEKVY